MSKIKGKTKEQKLAYLNSLSYNVLLKQKKGKFYLVIPELSLVAVNTNLDAAHKDLDIQKEKLFNEILDSESEDELEFPKQLDRRNEVTWQLKLFIYKLLIACFLLGATFTIVMAGLIDKLTSISWVDVAKRTADTFVLEADEFNVASQEVKQLRMQKFRNFLDGIQPFVNEIQHTFSRPSEQEEK